MNTQTNLKGIEKEAYESIWDDGLKKHSWKGRDHDREPVSVHGSAPRGGKVECNTEQDRFSLVRTVALLNAGISPDCFWADRSPCCSVLHSTLPPRGAEPWTETGSRS